MKAYLTFALLFAVGLWVGWPLRSVHLVSPGAEEEAKSRLTPQPEATLRLEVLSETPRSTDDVIVALVSVLQTEDYLNRRLAVANLVRDIPADRFAALIQAAQRVPLRFRKPLLLALLDQWLVTDKAACVEWVRSRPRNSAYIEVLARHAPREALEIMTGPGAPLNEWAGERIALEQLVGPDIHNQITLMSSFPVSGNRDGILAMLLQNLSLSDPAEAFRIASATFGWDRRGNTEFLLERWAESDPASALAEAGALLETAKLGVFGSQFAARLTQSIASKDPTLALQFALSLPEDLQRFPLITAVSEWATTDPASALTWAYEQGIELSQPKEPDSDQRESVLLKAFQEQPRGTADWLLALPDSPQRQQWIRALLADAMFTSTNVPLDFAPTSPASRLFSELAPDLQARLALSLGWELGQQERHPGDSEWMAQFPNEDVRVRVKAGALGAIWEKSPDRAEAMLASIPAGRERDWALKQVALHEAAALPEKSAQHALEITSAEIRRAALDDLIPEWLDRNAEACQEWLNAHTQLPPSWTADWLSKPASH